jgi:hypothetical protein
MKRDMELVKAFLLAIEGSEGQVEDLKKWSLEERSYHVALLLDASFVLGNTANDADGRPQGYFISRMTWAGHEFLDALRDDTIWKKAKEHVLKPGASWTFDVLKEWAKHEIKERLGLPVA